MAKRYVYTFQVQQRRMALPFPIDMLRYDACRPASEQDSNAIIRTFDPGSKRLDTPVTIRTDAYERKAWEPTHGRWQSFGWDVVPGSVERRES